MITAQVQVTIEADGESACIPVFVQPDSKQLCLLGNGEPLTVKEESNPGVAHVRLVEVITVPSLKGCFMKVKADYCTTGLKAAAGSPLLFEPQHEVFEPLGLSTYESLVTLSDDGCMLVTVQNYQGTT